MHRPLSTTSLVLLVATAACVGNERSADTFLVRDSAGVRIVESTAPAWTASSAWSVEPEPSLRLGVISGDAAHQFYQIRAVELQPDGGLVVLDGASVQLRRFDASGRHMWSAGQPGGGPGEFRQPNYVGRRADGTFLVWDRAFARLTAISPDGEFIDSEVHVPASGDPPSPYGVFADGALLATFPHGITPPAPGAVLTDTIDLWRYEPGPEQRRLLARLPGPTWIWTGRYQLPVPFTANPLRAVDGTRLVTAHGASPAVQIHDSTGAIVARYLLPQPPQPVGGDDVRALIGYFTENRFYGAPLTVWDEWIDRMPVPEHHPAFDRLIVAGNGEIWLRRFVVDPTSDAPPVWDVLSADGVYLGTLATPPRLEITSVAANRLAGIFRDENDVEFVHVHELHRRD